MWGLVGAMLLAEWILCLVLIAQQRRRIAELQDYVRELEDDMVTLEKYTATLEKAILIEPERQDPADWWREGV